MKSFLLFLLCATSFAGVSPQRVTAVAPLTLTGAGAMGCRIATGSLSGCLSATDWTTFNSKQSALSLGNLTSGTTGLTVTGGTGAVVGSGASVSVQTATGSQPGLLSAADWTTFNAKLTNPMTTAGDLIVGGASGAPTRVAAGTNTYVLTSNGAGLAPSWQAAASGVAWGAITGTLSNQTDLNTALGLKAPLASPTLTGTVTATAINAGAAANSLTLSTTDNLSGSTSDIIFSTGDASVTGGNTSGAFLFAEGNSATTKGIRVYNRDAGIGYSYSQMDYSGIRLPSNGSITAQSGQFFLGIPNTEGFGLGHANGINTYGHLVDALGDTAFIGGEASNGIYPFNRIYIGSGGIVVGAVTSGPGTVYAPLNALDIRGGAGAAYAQYTDTATGSTSGDGTLVGIDSSGNFIVNQQENLALTLKTAGSSRISINGSGTINLPGVTASRVLTTDGSSNLAASSVTTTTLGFLDATSSIQTQINTKAPSASPTFSGTTTFSSLTATTVPYLDASKVLTSSAVTPTELGYVSGVSSALQTQLNGKLATAGTGLVDDRGVTVETPAAATVPFGFVSYAATVNTARTKCEAGSLTANFQICHSGSCTSITSCSAISVTTSAANTSCTAAASIAAGDYLQVVVTSPSSASMCQLGLQVTR